MAEDLQIIKGTKEEQYEALIPQIKGLVEGETDLVANMANIAAALKEQFNWLWVGFYLVKKRRARARTLPGPGCLYPHKKGQGCLWKQLAGG